MEKKNPNIAVVLAGCGHLDGTAIHEAVLTLYSIEKHGATWECLSIDKESTCVVDHLDKKTEKQETRNILLESARIARGRIKSIAEADSNDYDAIIFPGGFGSAKNIFNFGVVGDESYTMDEDVLAFVRNFYMLDKPAGFICISPMMIPLIYPKGVKATIGTDPTTIKAITAKGAEHVKANATDVCIDTVNKVVSTPAYMNAKNMLEVSEGIDKLVEAVLEMI